MILMNPRTFRKVQDNRRQDGTPGQELFQIRKIHLFLLCNLFWIIGCSLFFAKKLVLGSIILEVGILFFTLSWTGLQKMDFHEIFKWKAPGFSNMGATLIIATCGIYVASFIDLIFRYYLQSFGKITVPGLVKPQSNSEFLFSLLAVVVLPAFSEEMLFRGFILQNYRKFLGNGQAIFLSALLFGLAHLNIGNFWGPFVLGIICGWLVCVFDTIIVACLAHSLNNGLMFLLSCLIPDYGAPKPISHNDMFLQIPAFIISSLIILIFVLRYHRKIPKKPMKPGFFLTVLCHWTTWILLLLFLIFVVVELVMMKTTFTV